MFKRRNTPRPTTAGSICTLKFLIIRIVNLISQEEAIPLSAGGKGKEIWGWEWGKWWEQKEWRGKHSSSNVELHDKRFSYGKAWGNYIITKYLHFLLGNLRLLPFEFICMSSFSCAIENGGFKRSVPNVFTYLIKHFI